MSHEKSNDGSERSSVGLVLVVDDDPQLRRLVARSLERSGYQVESYPTGEDCLAALSHVLPDAVCLDLDMPGLGGLETLKRIRARHRLLPVIILTGDSAVDSVVAAMLEGAYDYVVKPIDFTALTTRIRNAVDRGRMSVRLLELEREAKDRGYPGIVARSEGMRKIFGRMDRVAASDATVLIQGESGTGKELVARAIHLESGRANGPFVALNCAAIAETLQESELFGHEKGAFTGATEQRKGRFEQADQGTLFLDEIGELSLTLQAKLLRVIQERSFHRIGGMDEVASDFRLVAATHRGLRGLVEAGTFRDDLYFRVAVLELEVPPLRDRDGDIPLLCEYFLAQLNERSGTELSFTPEALEALGSFAWPGNVRELANVIEQAGVFCDHEVITLDDLPEEITTHNSRVALRRRESSPASIRRGNPAGSGSGSGVNGHIDDFKLENIEKAVIIQAIEAAKGNVPSASRLLGISRPTLYRKLKKYGIR